MCVFFFEKLYVSDNVDLRVPFDIRQCIFYASQGHGESVDRVGGKFSVAVHMPFFDVLRRVLDT